MSTWKRPVPRHRLIWFRIRHRGMRVHPWEYACDTEGCRCCEPKPEGKGWVRTPERDRK